MFDAVGVASFYATARTSFGPPISAEPGYDYGNELQQGLVRLSRRKVSYKIPPGSSKPPPPCGLCWGQELTRVALDLFTMPTEPRSDEARYIRRKMRAHPLCEFVRSELERCEWYQGPHSLMPRQLFQARPAVVQLGASSSKAIALPESISRHTKRKTLCSEKLQKWLDKEHPVVAQPETFDKAGARPEPISRTRKRKTYMPSPLREFLEEGSPSAGIVGAQVAVAASPPPGAAPPGAAFPGDQMDAGPLSPRPMDIDQMFLDNPFLDNPMAIDQMPPGNPMDIDQPPPDPSAAMLAGVDLPATAPESNFFDGGAKRRRIGRRASY